MKESEYRALTSGDPKSSKGKGRVPKRKTWEIEIEDPGNKFMVRVDYPSRGKGLGVGMCLFLTLTLNFLPGTLI